MATITKKALKNEKQVTGTPYGTSITLQLSVATTATGAVAGGDSTAAVAIGDVVRVGIVRAGMRLDDAKVLVSTACTAKVGFAYIDGVDSTAVPQDDDYFGAAIALNAAGRYVANNTAVRPVILPKDAYIILTTAGAANAKASQTDVLVEVTNVGIA